MVRKAVLAIAFLSLANLVVAQEETEEEGPWAGTLSLGYLSTSGNTDTTSYNTKFEVGYTKDSWEHRLLGSSTGAEDSGATTALYGLAAGGTSRSHWKRHLPPRSSSSL